MILLMTLLACGPDDAGDGSPCGRSGDAGVDDLAFEAFEWSEGGSLYDAGEPSRQVHKDRPRWESYLEANGRADPIPQVDLEGKDVFLWINRHDGCDPRVYDFFDAYAEEDTRIVVGSHTADTDCDLDWTTAWIFVLDEHETAEDARTCLEPEA